ncbi:MAG: hypothetical protein H0V41_02425 [Pseudonocardiales bacterium]|nr:hypothetical protein [Pseudonocardiales bacterium]
MTVTVAAARYGQGMVSASGGAVEHAGGHGHEDLGQRPTDAGTRQDDLSRSFTLTPRMSRSSIRVVGVAG